MTPMFVSKHGASHGYWAQVVAYRSSSPKADRIRTRERRERITCRCMCTGPHHRCSRVVMGDHSSKHMYTLSCAGTSLRQALCLLREQQNLKQCSMLVTEHHPAPSANKLMQGSKAKNVPTSRFHLGPSMFCKIIRMTRIAPCGSMPRRTACFRTASYRALCNALRS